jgi:hypothetical protein
MKIRFLSLGPVGTSFLTGSVFFAILVWFAILGTAIAQKDKKWTDWNKKEAQKILEDSPWAKAQTEQITSSHPGAIASITTDANAPDPSVVAVNSKFHVRFYSARPIRQALLRLAELDQKPDPATVQKLHVLGEMKSEDSVIVTLTYQSPDQRHRESVLKALSSADTFVLQNHTYLERSSDGKQLLLKEYVPPGKDTFGARFIFSRNVNGTPFIDDKSGEIHFSTQYPNGIKIDRRFKVADMIYEGALEY